MDKLEKLQNFCPRCPCPKCNKIRVEINEVNRLKYIKSILAFNSEVGKLKLLENRSKDAEEARALFIKQYDERAEKDLLVLKSLFTCE